MLYYGEQITGVYKLILFKRLFKNFNIYYKIIKTLESLFINIKIGEVLLHYINIEYILTLEDCFMCGVNLSRFSWSL